MTLSEHDIQRFAAFEKSGWEEAAARYHHHWGALSSQSAGPLLDAVKVEPKAKVLDVATGAGYLAAAAAQRGAEATGIDFVDAQVELARRLHPEIEFQIGNAEDLPFETGTFNAVVIGFGVNHLPRPEAAFAEAFRVLKSDGYLGFTVWAAPNQNQGFGIVLGAIERLGVPNAQLPPAPPYFRFADRDEVARTLRDSGFVDPVTLLVQQTWHHDSPEDLFDAFNEGAVRATAMLRAQPEHVRGKIREVIREQVQRLKQGDEYVIAVPAVLSSARKP